MAKATKAEMTGRFLELLRLTNPAVSQDRRERYLQSRLIGMGHGRACSRCGGCGEWSWNPMHGSMCYGCLGTGFVAQPLTAKLYKELEAEVAEGKLDTYLAELRRRQAIAKAAKSAGDRVMAAWMASGVSEQYQWELAADGVFPHNEISHRFNVPMADIHTAISRRAMDLQYRKGAPSGEEARRDWDAEGLRLAEELTADTDAAVAEIERLAGELAAFLAQPEVRAAQDAYQLGVEQELAEARRVVQELEQGGKETYYAKRRVAILEKRWDGESRLPAEES